MLKEDGWVLRTALTSHVRMEGVVGNNVVHLDWYEPHKRYYTDITISRESTHGRRSDTSITVIYMD